MSIDTINRTIFGIETKNEAKTLLDAALQLSIAPSLELKQKIKEGAGFLDINYQSHHLWN